MANSAEIIQLSAIQSTCRKILLSIEVGECKTLADVQEYINDMLSDVKTLQDKKGIMG
jgi:hypothetical protein